MTTGGRDSKIINFDVRKPNPLICNLTQHRQEICGLKWSPDGKTLASGGNDNIVCLWDLGRKTPRAVLEEHNAGIKAIAWCPWQKGLLATGGGTQDKTIKLWQADTGQLLRSQDAGSQVSSLIWNRYDKELLSGHGFTQNQLSLWAYPSMTKFGDLKGHTNRVLSLCLSPDGKTVLSAAADETLRFWKLFDDEGKNAEKFKKSPKLLSMKFR